MEHVTIKNLSKKYFLLRPEKGYILVNLKDGRKYTEAVTESPREFKVVKI